MFTLVFWEFSLLFWRNCGAIDLAAEFHARYE